jgi:hypothetical protein
MKIFLIFILTITSALAGVLDNYIPKIEKTDIFFSSKDDITNILIDKLNEAKVAILIDAHAISNIQIVQELVRIQNTKNVFVVVIMNPNPNVKNYVVPAYLMENNVAVMYSQKTGKGNNFIIVDDYVITGSYDYSQGALHGKTNINIERQPTKIDAFKVEFLEHINRATLPKESVYSIEELRDNLIKLLALTTNKDL